MCSSLNYIRIGQTVLKRKCTAKKAREQNWSYIVIILLKYIKIKRLILVVKMNDVRKYK